MSPEKNLVENNLELRRELEAANELIKRYEHILSEIENKNNSRIRKSVHDLSNPLQIISMTIEALQMKASLDLQPALERMRSSTEVMTAIIAELRTLRSQTYTSLISDQKATQVV